jgi:hypothetical protein
MLFFANRLSINPFCEVFFTTQRVSDVNFNLRLIGIRIKNANNCRYLGIVIDSSPNLLKWAVNIDHIRRNMLGYFIYYGMNYLQMRCKNVYFAIVHSYILYGIGFLLLLVQHILIK